MKSVIPEDLDAWKNRQEQKYVPEIKVPKPRVRSMSRQLHRGTEREVDRTTWTEKARESRKRIAKKYGQGIGITLGSKINKPL